MAARLALRLEAVARALHARRVFPGQWSKRSILQFLEAIASSHRGAPGGGGAQLTGTDHVLGHAPHDRPAIDPWPHLPDSGGVDGAVSEGRSRKRLRPVDRRRQVTKERRPQGRVLEGASIIPVHAVVRADPTAMRGEYKAGRVATERLRPCRWTGTYASAKDRLMLVDKPSGRAADRADHQRHRRQHVVRDRRGSRRGPLRTA